MRIARVSVVGVLLAVGLSSPTALAGPSQRLTVTGSGTVSVDWRVTGSTRLDFSRVAMTTHGDVVAFAVERLASHEIVAMAADAPRLEYDVHSPVFGDYPNSKIGPEHTVDEVVLTPGRYRLRLVAHGESTVVVPVTSGRGASLRARVPSAGTALLADPRVNGSSASLWQHDFLFRGKAMGLLATHEHTYIYGMSAMDECVQQLTESGPGPCRAHPTMAGATAFGGAAVGDGWCRSTLYFNSAWIPTGRFRAEVTTATVGVDKEMLVLFALIEPTR
ncbi:MAG: hypothetical protein QOK42_2691 [Frankiaceae bacterium]|jgi:hypothetical protein|nr:hypothetical protein [Frankiaceae bacterium]MDX6226590.1 hypothetical protein [Frankiales bacterium]